MAVQIRLRPSFRDFLSLADGTGFDDIPRIREEIPTENATAGNRTRASWMEASYPNH
jgi:hypothetical protein